MNCILDAQDITVELIEPDPASQQFPCPNQRVIYECRVLAGAFSVTWVLPSGDDAVLILGGSEQIGTTRNTSDGQFTATLTGSESVGMAGAFKINSTILIKPPLDVFNNSVVTCRANSIVVINPTNMSTITLSGELRPISITFCDCLGCI